MGKLKVVAGVLVILTVTQVDCMPRKKLVKSLDGSSRNSRLASILSDYWTERGFHDAPTDNLMASESQGKDLMMTGDDDVSDFRGKTKIRIPRGRLTPPGVASKQRNALKKLANRRRQQRKRLMAMKMSQHQQYHYPQVRVMNPIGATRKQDDMEILESVTLIDGGTPQSDGSIKIRPSGQQSQRKYHQEHFVDEDQISPLNYRLQDDDLSSPYKQQQQQQQYLRNQPQEPALSASYYSLQGDRYPSGEPQGKLSLGQLKQPKSIPLQSMSLNQFQQQLYQQQQQPPVPHQPHQLAYPTPKPQVVPIFVIPPPSKPHQMQTPLTHPPPLPPPSPSPQQFQTTPPPPPPPSSSPSMQSHPSLPQSSPNFNTQLFQQQFHHPFATQPPSQLSSLAQLTATLLSGASSVAAATSAAAAALAKGEMPNIPTPPLSPSSAPLQQQISPSGTFPRYSGFAQQQFGPPSGGLLSEASIPSASQVLLPTPPPRDAFPTSTRPGVIAIDDQFTESQLKDQPESLANQITKLVETGRKILYFPKGVMDTMDVLLKQMERNPMVAYWGDKFFAKVFGDTSGT